MDTEENVYTDTTDLLNERPGESIVVAIRKRPKIMPREAAENDVVRCDADSVAVYEPRTKLDLTPVIEPSTFSFDTVFGETTGNREVYERCCRPLLDNVRGGGVAVIFAFGQTGSGKTYTMLGQGEEPGLYGLAVTDLLQLTHDSDALVVSFYEVYGSKLYDLLNDRAELKMLQDEYKNIHIVGLTERHVRTVEDVHVLMQSGQQLRAIGTTHANDRSSRSHAVLEIKLKIINSDTVGRMTFVDLAGSERASDTAETDAKTRREGAEINKSLLALKECIRAMSMRKRHIPFRGSKLTQILRESFVGRSRTCVVATVSPCQSHCEDTLNTLRYADRIKELKGPTADALGAAPIPCKNCGLPIFVGDQHVCRRQVVQCPHCREELDKLDLEKHLTECKECPTRCAYCNERMVRGEVQRHNRRCVKLPVRCAACGQMVPRNMMEKHTQTECTAAKAKCRYCGGVFVRQALQAHESSCDAMKVACTFCLKFVRKKALEGHEAGCLMNPNRVAPPASPGERGSPGSLPGRRATSQQASPATSRSPSMALTPDSCNRPLEEETSVPAFPPTPPAEHNSLLDTALPPSRSAGRSPGLNKEDESLSVCPYARYGCPVKVSRLNLTAHLEEAVADHLELVTSYADRADEQNSQLRRLIVKQGK